MQNQLFYSSTNLVAKRIVKNPNPAATHKNADGAILSDNTPAKAGTNTPPIISAIAAIRPIAFAFKCEGTALEGITAAAKGNNPIIK